jgi:hypothetical protein
MQPIIKVQEELSRVVLSLPGVAATAVGRTEAGRDAILVFLAEDVPGTRAKIPVMADGYPVVIKVTGKLKPL